MTPPITPLGSRYGINSALGRSVKRAAAGNWWLAGGIPAANCIAAYQPKGAASYAASKINLANPGAYDADDENSHSPDWSAANGWYCSRNKYLLSGIVPAGGYSMIVRISGLIEVTEQQNACGVDNYTVGQRFYLRPIHGYANHVYGYGNVANIVTNKVLSGVMCIAGTNCYLDGVADGIAGTWADIAFQITIGALNHMGVNPAINPLNGYINALAIYNSTITAAQVSALTDAMELL